MKCDLLVTWFLSEKQQIPLFYFFLGLITDFTDRAENILFSEFELMVSYFLLFVINLAWGPGRIPFALLSDRLVKKTNRWVHGAIACALFAPFFLVVGLMGRTNSLIVIWGLLVFGEFGPALLHTLMDALKAEYYNKTQTNISQVSDRFRYIGVVVGKLMGATILQESTLFTVFICQFGLLTVIGVLMAIVSRIRVDTPQIPSYDKMEIDVWEAEQDQASDGYQVPKVVLTNSSAISTRTILFAFLFMILPTGSMCLFYFEYGPLGITQAQFGWMDFATSSIPLVVTFLPTCIKLSQRQLAMTVAFSMFTLALFRVVLVSQLLVLQGIGNYPQVFWIECLSTAAESIFVCYYNLGATESSVPGEEASALAKVSVSVTAGRAVRVSIEAALTGIYTVNKTNFNALPMLLVTCFGLSGLLPLASVFV
jgi:hypothetical protein